jgi:hypothetical protein
MKKISRKDAKEASREGISFSARCAIQHPWRLRRVGAHRQALRLVSFASSRETPSNKDSGHKGTNQKRHKRWALPARSANPH